MGSRIWISNRWGSKGYYNGFEIYIFRTVVVTATTGEFEMRNHTEQLGGNMNFVFCFGDCDTIILLEIYTWSLSLFKAQSSWNPRNFPELIEVSFVMLMRMENQPWLDDWNFQSHPLISGEEIRSGNAVNDPSCPLDEACRRPKSTSSENIRVDEYVEIGEGGSTQSSTPFPHPVHLFHLAVSWVVFFYNKPVS